MGRRVNSLRPGIIMTPLALDELNSPAGALYQEMIKTSAAGRVGTPDEIEAVAAFLIGRLTRFEPRRSCPARQRRLADRRVRESR